MAPWYGRTFISRPYIDLADKTPSAQYFAKIKTLWENKEILIVECLTTRSGRGNDLFDNAKSIKRIICPSKNAYDKVQEIKESIRQHCANKLVLLMLGPCAKVLVYELCQEMAGEGENQFIDIGHIDSEYEWYKMGATHKTKLRTKHTAEFNFDTDIELIEDEEYNQQILVNLV